MRLLFLSNANSIHLKEWTEYFARELGHDVAVLTIPAPTLGYAGVEVVHIGNSWSDRKIFWPALLPRLRAELRRRKPDLFIAYRVVSYGFLASLAGYHPLALAAQGGSLVWPPGDPIGRACVRHAVRRADLLNAWADNIRTELLRYGADPESIFVCSRGIDLDHFPGLPDPPPGPLKVVMTRALLPSYNVRQLVDAMPMVLREVPDAVCEIAGDGSERGALEKRARELGLDQRVRFLGRVSHQKLLASLAGAHIYVSTTISDGLPLSHFEAMAAGVFPVCTDITANRLWIRPGENGGLAPVGHPAALAREIVRAWRDPALRERARVENRRMVEEKFDRRVNMRRIEARWMEVVARRKRA